MMRIQRLLIIGGSIIALALLAGCEPDSANSSLLGLESASRASVTLHVGAKVYQTSDTISVTLSNQSTKTIYFPDHLTNCTVILLQRQQADGNWQAVNPCRLAAPTRLHSLDAGQSLAVKLLSKQWLPGLYRATLSYRTPLSSTRLNTIYSEEFRVV